MEVKVVKFGGTSLADAGQFGKVKEIVMADAARKIVVVSAPGKRSREDEKVTDLLLKCYQTASIGGNYHRILEQIEKRFADIVEQLGLAFPLKEEIKRVEKHLMVGCSEDYIASRGEYLNGKIMAEYLGFHFLDAKDCVLIRDGKCMLEASAEKIRQAYKEWEYLVIPGFYGTDEDGEVTTFARGGSDITGSIAARAVDAGLYENWTDVSGIYAVDPHITENPIRIKALSYRELRELSYMGAGVFHEDAVMPVQQANIPIFIGNTNAPNEGGTMIVPEFDTEDDRIITGIAGKSGFSAILIEKVLMNREVGFGKKVLEILEKYHLAFEHLPTGIDAISVVLSAKELEPVKEKVIEEIERAVEPDLIKIEEHQAMIAVVGRKNFYEEGIAVRIIQAAAREGIKINMMDQSFNGISMILGVAEQDYEKGIRAIYREFEGMKQENEEI